MSESALFVYGSLMLLARRTRVIGRPLAALDATLRDHERKLVRGTPYPAARSKLGSFIRGELLFGLSRSELARLDAYEGELYRRVQVNAEAAGRTYRSSTYVIAPAFEHRLSDVDWSLEEFCRLTDG